MRNRRVIAIIVGCALDAVFGDPHGWPHPVRLIGKQIQFEERLVREYLLPQAAEAGEGWPLDDVQTEKLAGAALAADVALVAPCVTVCASKLLEKASPVASLAFESVVLYQLIAARSLYDESMAVYEALKSHDLASARARVGLIVGRDTDALDEEGVARAAVETVAENASDAVIAPLLYMGVGGIGAAMFYKAVNTLDSMVGYKNDAYLHLGWAAAKLDDAVNIVPSRVAGVLMCGAAKLSGLDAARAWRLFKRDRFNHASPNAGQTEAACAGALGVRLGGPNSYFGNVVDKPVIGSGLRGVQASDIPQANRLMGVTALLGAGLAVACAVLNKK